MAGDGDALKGTLSRLLHPRAGGRGSGADGAAVSPPLYRSSTYRMGTAAEHAIANAEQTHRFDVYGRYGNPTTRAAAAMVAELEGAAAGLLFASGMAAISTAITTLVPAGGTVIASGELYGGTQGVLRDQTERGVTVSRFDPTDPATLAQRLQSGPAPDLVFCESVSNPLTRVARLRVLGSMCRDHGVMLCIDNTFGAAMAVKPLQHGATVVLHSATKYLNGHTDVVAGVACGDEALIERLWAKMIHNGGCVDPTAAWLLARGLRTLPLRWARQCETAARLATALAGHRRVTAVHYPGLPDHPDHAAVADYDGVGGVLAFEIDGGTEAALRVLNGFRLCSHAPSLGGIETLVCSPARTSHARVEPELRAAAGISDGLIRVSVGLEDWDDLWDDFERALE